jgi:hypothetical protein
MSTLVEEQHGGLQHRAQGLRAGIPLRGLVLVIGVLAIQLGFIGSYVGAFHSPTPHNVPVAVVAPSAVTTTVVTELDDLPGRPVRAEAVASAARARQLIGDEALDGAFIVTGPRSVQLLVASADGGALSEAVTEVARAFTAAGHEPLTVADIVPSNRGDARGLSDFYLAVGWSIGGYLVTSLLAVATRPRPRGRREALARLSVLAVYSVLSGVGGALIVGSVNALPGHTAALSALGALLVFAVGAFSMALEAFAGVYGIGLVIVLLVVLGNPSAGGAYPAPLLPTFWRAVGTWLPPGAGTTAIRTIVYFSTAGVLHQLLVLAGYSAAGITGTLAVSRSQVVGAY